MHESVTLHEMMAGVQLGRKPCRTVRSQCTALVKVASIYKSNLTKLKLYAKYYVVCNSNNNNETFTSCMTGPHIHANLTCIFFVVK
jgi:hypothetical protein